MFHLKLYEDWRSCTGYFNRTSTPDFGECNDPEHKKKFLIDYDYTYNWVLKYHPDLEIDYPPEEEDYKDTAEYEIENRINARQEYFKRKRNGEDVKYVEGEAFVPLEYGEKDWVHHAWLLVDGEIYDPTYGENDYQYRGTPVKDEFMTIVPKWFHKMLVDFGGVEQEDIEGANIRVTDRSNFGKKAFENMITKFEKFEYQDKKLFTSEEIFQMYKDDNRRITGFVQQALDEYKLWKLILINPNSIDTLKDETELYQKDPQNVNWYEKNIRGRMEREGENFPILIEYKYKSKGENWHYKRNALYPKPIDGWHRLIAAKKLGLKKIQALIPV